VHCDDWAKGQEAIASEKIEYPVANDDGEKTQKAYEITGYPTVYVIDKKGIIRHVDPPDMEEAVKALLAESG